MVLVLSIFFPGTVGGSPSYVVSNISLNWMEAQKFCRKYYFDLASVRNQSENDRISILGSFLWIGLYREKLWSDGSTSLFRYWASGQPTLSDHECVTANFYNSGEWHDAHCSLPYPFICYKPIPPNAGNFGPSAQDETSITLQWDKINNNISFVLQFNGTETNISAPQGNGPINHTVSSLSAGTKYTFILFSVLDSIRSNGVQITAVTAPENAEGFSSSSQNESSITLQWDKRNNNYSYVLFFNGAEIFINAPHGDGPVTHTLSSLTAGTKYTFLLTTVFENVRSRGVQLSAVTAPQNPSNFRPLSQDETSITLQWDKINNNTSFVLQFNGTETNIGATDRDGPLTHTVTSLTAGAKYTFTLFSVFENVRSNGVSINATTGGNYIVALDMNLKTYGRLSDSEIQALLAEVRVYCFFILFCFINISFPYFLTCGFPILTVVPSAWVVASVFHQGYICSAMRCAELLFVIKYLKM
uniref:Tyrosine-protein phosphatase Lar-like n=1 Tax=Cyprinodon variegatus TaxID=28743 RepID=A0A3Q2FNU8_CYPVA